MHPSPSVLEILERVPFLAGRNVADWRVESIGSITNQTFRATSGTESYVIRQSGPTTRYLDRRVEAHNAAIAARLGLTPPILFQDDALLVTRFIEGARALAVADLADPALLLKVGALLARLQSSDVPFAGERHPFGEIDKYLSAYAHPRAVTLRKASAAVESALARTAPPLVPAHVDASAANFLLCADGSLQLVDWEFSSMADPAWDAASVLGQRPVFDDAAGREFIASVLGEAGDATLARVGLFKGAMSLVAGSWCAMEAHVRRDDTLMRIADGYLDRCAAFLTDPRLERWLRAE